MIRGGTTAIVFGEGTRSRDGRLKPLKKGPFVLAIQAGVPVVPAYLQGTFEVLPKGSVAPRPHPITLRVGRPIPTAGSAMTTATGCARHASRGADRAADHVDDT